MGSIFEWFGHPFSNIFRIKGVIKNSMTFQLAFLHFLFDFGLQLGDHLAHHSRKIGLLGPPRSYWRGLLDFLSLLASFSDHFWWIWDRFWSVRGWFFSIFPLCFEAFLDVCLHCLFYFVRAATNPNINIIWPASLHPFFPSSLHPFLLAWRTARSD